MKMVMAVGLTVIFELLAFVLFIKRKVPKAERKLWVACIIGLNLFTNPLAQVVYYNLAHLMTDLWGWLSTEFIVIITEALLIHWVMQVRVKSSFVYSVILNSTSILLGELITWVL